MNYNIVEATLDDIKVLMSQYLKTINGVTDDFWEAHVFGAVIYKILAEEKEIGCFAIFQNEKITLFYLQEQYIYLAQPIFKQILEDYSIKTAFVSTGDQLFLSLCMDLHSKIELQAYFFDGTVMGEVRPPEYPRDTFFDVKPEELEEVLANTGEFFVPIAKEQLESGENRLYKLCENGEVLGYGIIVPNRLLTQYWPVGMIVLEHNRCKGVGRSIQMHLADISRENGYIPISGCWYFNQLSKKTIESAGRYTKTRLLNVTF
ncbi:MAG: hypothetical protein ACYDEX_19005 [Mobilitalea sp.]